MRLREWHVASTAYAPTPSLRQLHKKDAGRAPKMPTTPIANFAGDAAPSGFGGGAMTLQPGSSGVSGSLSCESCD